MLTNQDKSCARKKVLYLITKSNFGGAQRYVYDLATNLPREQYEAVVAFGGTGVPGSEAGQLAKMLETAHVRTVLIPSLGRNFNFLDVKSFFQIHTLIKQERPDVLHLNSPKAGGLGALAGRITGVGNIIYTAHGWPFWEERNVLWLGAVRLFSWLTVLLSHHTICISEYDRRGIRWMPFIQRKLVVIRNGIRTTSYIPRAEARAMLVDRARHEKDVWLATIAELHPNKNIERALDAVQLYNQSHKQKIFYCVFGGGELANKLAGRIDNQLLLGFIPDATRYLSAFDVFLLPSLKEGVPYAILEAGLAGLPVVASDVGGIPEVLAETADGYLVNPQSVEDIMRGLTEATCGISSPHSSKKRLSEIVREKFSQSDMLKKTFMLYEQ